MSNKYRDDFFKDSANKSNNGLYTCVSCGRKFSKDDITIDHILPQSRGGGHNIDNLQCMCRSCNSRKNNNTSRITDDYIKNGKRIINADIRNISRSEIKDLDNAISKGKSGIKKWLNK